MPGPKTGPCGGVGEPACPPTPASGTTYTLEEMQAHGQLNYNKGRSDAFIEHFKANQGHQGAL